MNHRHDHGCSGDSRRSEETAGGQREGSGRLTAAKAFRAVSAIVVFGIPLLAGTAALVGCGLHRVYKRITGSAG